MEEDNSFEVEPDVHVVQINITSNDQEDEEYEQSTLLTIQSHLVTFASEGLRILSS